MQARVLLVSTLTAVILAGGCQPQDNSDIAIDHYARAVMLIEEGDVDTALAELAEAVGQNPTLSIAFATTGDIYRQRGDYQQAAYAYENACQANPYAFKAHYNLGTTYQALSRAAQAATRVEEYLRSAIRVYLRAITLRPDDFESNLNLAVCYFQIGKYQLAEQYCKAAIEINPSDPHGHCNLGIIYDSQDRFYAAIRAYKASLEIDTHQPKLLINIGSTYMRQNRMKLAVQAFEMAAREDPADPTPREQLGSCYYRLSEYKSALDAYKQAAALNANSSTVHRGLGVVYMTQYVLDQERTELRDRALAAWHTSLELRPGQADLQRLLNKYTPKYSGPKL